MFSHSEQIHVRKPGQDNLMEMRLASAEGAMKPYDGEWKYAC